MNMKSLLLIPFLMISIGLGIWSGMNVRSTGGELAWIGAFLAILAFPVFIIVTLSIAKPARTSARLPGFQLVTLAGLAITAYATFGPGAATTPPGYAPFAVALFGVIGLQWYVRIYSSYGRKKSSAVAIGSTLPDLPLETLDGKSVSTASFHGSKTLIVFFRANWCPLCMAQLKEIRALADRLAAAGVQVRFISNQSVKKSHELERKLKLPDHFQILFDKDLRAAKELAIEDLGGTPAGMMGYPKDTVMATVIALDADGVVIFGDETDNYRVRPHPETFMSVFEG